jgi:GAF domain-containing protein
MSALRETKLLDTRPSVMLDNVTATMSELFDIPVVLVSLTDDHRQWFKSRVNFEGRETGRECSLCSWTLLLKTGKVLLVTNAETDPRFKDNPHVAGLELVRFYAGAPLVVNGHALGTLCLIDVVPHEDFGIDKVRMLQSFAKLVCSELSRPVHHGWMVDGMGGGRTFAVTFPE